MPEVGVAERNGERVRAGRPADEVSPEGVAAADQAFRLLGGGLATALPA